MVKDVHGRCTGELFDKLNAPAWVLVDSPVTRSGKATASLKEHGVNLANSVLVGQIRTTTLDLLMSTGIDQTQALQALEEDVGSASEIG